MSYSQPEPGWGIESCLPGGCEGKGRWHCLGVTEQAMGIMPALGPWGLRGGGQEQLISSRRSAVRGPQTHKPFIGVSGGETRMWTLFILDFTFLFSL